MTDVAARKVDKFKFTRLCSVSAIVIPHLRAEGGQNNLFCYYREATSMQREGEMFFELILSLLLIH